MKIGMILFVYIFLLSSAHAGPLQGKVNDATFKPEIAELNNGQLKFKQSNSHSNKYEIMIFLFLEKGILPQGKTFISKSGDTKFGTKPHVHVKWKIKGKSSSDSKIFMNKYDLNLKFDKYKNKYLSGNISFTAKSNEVNTSLKGQFKAKVDGFILIDGNPDLSTNSFENLKYLATEYISKKEKILSDKVLKHTNVTMANYNDIKKDNTGYLVVHFEKNGEKDYKKLQFRKVKDKWLVWRELNKPQINTANPIHPFELGKKGYSTQLKYKASQLLEKEYSASPYIKKGKGIEIGGFLGSPTASYNSKVKMAEVKLTYKVDGEKEKKKKYLYRLVDKEWVFDRLLKDSEKVDYRKGKVVSNK